MKAVAYIRVSTSDQALSPDAQLEAINRWAELNGYEIVESFADIGVSGGAALDKRPQLMLAIDALKEDGVEAIVVSKRDRLARDVMSAAMIEQLVERKDCKVLSADGTGNGTGPEQMLVRGLMDLFAQYERAIIRARTTAAMQQKKSKGEYCGGHVPFGYSLGVMGQLVPCPVEREAIQVARKLRERGNSLRAIGRILTNHGFPPRKGRWHAKTVRDLIMSEAV